MTKKKLIVYIFLAVFAAISLLIAFNAGVIFQRGNPMPYISKALTLSESRPYIDVFGDGITFITKRGDKDELFNYIEETFDAEFYEQAGSGYGFNSNGKLIYVSSEIYWSAYTVWDIDFDFRAK